VNPCDDFYHFACGTWLKNNPIPSDQAAWGSFAELNQRNQFVLKDILEKAAARGQSGTPLEQKIGAFYSSCMDVKAINEMGFRPIAPEIDRINAIHDLTSLSEEIGRLQRMNVDAVFGYGSGQDFKDATVITAAVDQGGLGLPERDYYFKTDKTSVDIREKYVANLQQTFVLLGDAADAAKEKAATVMKIETALAKDSQDVTSRRDPATQYHMMTRADMISLAPAFAWNVYLPIVHGDQPKFNVVAPDFFRAFGKLLDRLSFDDWKVYLIHQLVSADANLLAKPFDDTHFDFYARTLSGQKEQRPRWKRCVALTDNALGEALGQAYVDRTFGAEGKERTQRMVREIESSMEQDLKSVNWMSLETKQLAFEKLHAVANKIGYPDKWRDYSKFQVMPGDLVGNVTRGREFENDRQMAKIGQPVDKTEWGMTPPTVNAYYDPQMNNINFPAGILQPPFYTAKGPEAMNYGAVGAVVGHELTHGFDDQGRQFDAQGNFRDWWKQGDAEAYEGRAKCIEDEYGNFIADGDVKLNGKLTEGENIADNGGLRLAYMALTTIMSGKKLSDVDGFTPQQQFFLGWADVWCQNMTPEVRRLQAQTNPHALPEFRVNGTVENMPEFAAAFSCKIGQPMAPKKNCRVW
jgi:endothelin-converting enzyme/putative endopeptidase